MERRHLDTATTCMPSSMSPDAQDVSADSEKKPAWMSSFTHDDCCDVYSDTERNTWWPRNCDVLPVMVASAGTAYQVSLPNGSFHVALGA